MIETWKDIEWAPGYSVSDFGHVRGPGDVPIKPHVGMDDYLMVSLGAKDGYSLSHFVHQLVAEAFLGAKPRHRIVHRDGLRFNNVLDNLVALTASGRPLRKTSARAMRVREITTGQIFDSQREAARILGVDQREVGYSIKGRRTRMSYQFEKVDI